MADPNTVTLNKEIDSDGIVTIDVDLDNIIGNAGATVMADIYVEKNGDSPTIPLRGIRWLSNGQPLEYSNASRDSYTAKIHAQLGESPIVTKHLDAGTAAVEQLYVLELHVDAYLTENDAIVTWTRNGSGHNRINLWVAV